ncbi:hypothetical protein [Paracidobacterium acidisoli]|uniref:hypothetical protein n=1 Tax=Paracidobacterium acidisoli TaxID=2303751 RepID=UPI0011C1CA93|nr:hypothetical protein [Paracidobacterium acidisoli]MBT9331643.1 hypothetical protein [Paracidobacterium acidisoli]
MESPVVLTVRFLATACAASTVAYLRKNATEFNPENIPAAFRSEPEEQRADPKSSLPNFSEKKQNAAPFLSLEIYR